jgi:hypothetical protein
MIKISKGLRKEFCTAIVEAMLQVSEDFAKTSASVQEWLHSRESNMAIRADEAFVMVATYPHMCRWTIGITDQQHQSLKALAAFVAWHFCGCRPFWQEVSDLL